MNESAAQALAQSFTRQDHITAADVRRYVELKEYAKELETLAERLKKAIDNGVQVPPCEWRLYIKEQAGPPAYKKVLEAVVSSLSAVIRRKVEAMLVELLNQRSTQKHLCYEANPDWRGNAKGQE